MAFTNEQTAAIEAQGRTIVSASAGSGKTTVMIEKIVRLIQSGVEVSKVLALTFTKKAAAQMKEKLRKELIKTINAEGTGEEKKKALKEQLAAVSGADISTIHSFCAKFIRSHFFAAEVNSDFFILGDAADEQELKNRAMDTLFEEAYEEADERFLKLLSVYFRKKKDQTLRQILSDAYDKLRVRADYRTFLSGEAVQSNAEKFDEICTRLFDEMRGKCAYYAEKIKRERAYFEGAGQARSVANADELLAALDSLRNAKDYFEACKVAAPKFSAKQKVSKTTPPDFEGHVNALSDWKEAVKKIYAENAKVRGRDEELSDYLCAGEIAAYLAVYLLKFDEKYAEVKREKNCLDYNDLEHITLKLLSDEAIREEMQDRYRYVFVDEYQDVNPVQESILSLLGKDNVFLVGDIKQSIYGFRGSKSRYFAEKQRAFERDDGAQSLWLTRNFRSADSILEAVNTQFIQAMTPMTSEVDYAADSRMEGGGMYASNQGRVQVHFYGTEESKEEKEAKKSEAARRGIYSVEANYLKARAESSRYGKAVREIIERERASTWYNVEDGKFHRVEYSDIAILTRKKKGSVEQVVTALSGEGIPVTSASAVNICDFPEIKTLTDILSLIDNTEQDVPLCSALLSAMGDLTTDDLVEIRLAFPKEKFYRRCCEKYAAEKEDVLAHKLRKFYGYLDELRLYAAVADAGEVLSKILAETKMEARLLALDNGAACLKRIHHFLSQTLIPEPLSVHAFLDRLRTMDNKIPYNENGGENAVRVITIHASKGLEYPIVIFNDLSASFAGKEERNVLIDEEYALVPKCYRRETMTCTETLLWKLCEKKNKAEEVKDELNLFYVALTRAKYGLHLLFESRPAAPDVRFAGCYADFVDMSLWKDYINDEAVFDLPKQERTAVVREVEPMQVTEIYEELVRRYPYEGGENLPLKTSASAEIAAIKNDNAALFEDTHYDVPVLFKEEETGDLRLAGLAYHAFLEHFDFSRLNGKPMGQGCDERKKSDLSNVVFAELERMKKEKLLTAEELALISPERAAAIVELPVFQEVSCSTLYREQEFLAALPAKEIYSDPERYGSYGEEEIVFQGAIDLLAVGADGVRIIDYKYSSHGAERLKNDYGLQLALYKKAVAKIMRVEEEKIRCTIVNIRLGFAVDLID